MLNDTNKMSNELPTTATNGNGNGNNASSTFTVKAGLARMLKGGVIMDVVNAEQARIAEEAGAVAVMALERVPADIRAQGGVARMSDPKMIREIMETVTIPVMAKARIGHFVECQILQSIGVDYIDESEVLTPADALHHVEKHPFTIPFVCGCRNLGEALRRISEGAAMIRTKGEAGTGDVIEAVRHQRQVTSEIRAASLMSDEELRILAKDIQAPFELLKETARLGRLPVVNFAAGGIATPADAALMMQLGCDGVFVGSGIFKSGGDKGNPTPTNIPIIPNNTSKKLIRSTKSFDRFILKSSSKDKSFFHFYHHQNQHLQSSQETSPQEPRQQPPQQHHHHQNKKLISTSASCSNLKSMVEFTDNVEQLIRETDEAFQAVGFALGDAKAATRGFQQFNSSKVSKITGMSMDNLNNLNNLNNTIIPRQNRSIGNKSISRTNSISKRNQMQNSNSLKERPLSIGLSGKSPVPKSIINSKAKKSNSPKQKKITVSDKASRKSLPHPHSSARWNLGDVTASMADVFRGKFTRLEADEMLTPDRLQQLEEKAEKAKLENERKASLENAQIEAARNVETVNDVDGIASMEKSHKRDGDKMLDTNIISSSDNSNKVSPTEPFQLENLLPRINNDKTSSSPQITGSSSPRPSASADTSESSDKEQKAAPKPLPDLPDPDYDEIDAVEQAFEDLHFPSPPRDSPHSPPRLPRSRSNTGMTSLLPTIPEISPLNIISPRTPKRTFSQDSDYSQESSTFSIDYIQLPSTPYTLTSPLFRHGPIRLEHVYHGHNRDSVSAPDLEEALDWTAFQMAISGTMDDGTIGASEESIWEADEAEIDSIFDWWSGFGYPGIGRLVKEAPISRRKRGKSLAANDAEKCPRKNKEGRDNRATTIGLGLGFGLPSGNRSGRPKTPEYKGGLWVETIRNSAPQVVEPGLTLGARRDAMLQVRVPEPKIDDDDDDDNDSLPPSPINLVKIKDEYIPMGYNLGHDLGDFLNWETYHVQSLFGEDEGRSYM